MKRYIASDETIFAMSKIVDKYAIPEISNDIGKFVYFSECNTSHSPRIQFYGGTKETSTTRNAPTLKFDLLGNCEVLLAPWMDKQNCPNAFNHEYVDNLRKFIQNNKSILLLVWFGHLDEADALAYFHGQTTLNTLLSDIDFELPESIKTVKELDVYCLENNLYAGELNESYRSNGYS